jgi:hypothetical protein
VIRLEPRKGNYGLVVVVTWFFGVRTLTIGTTRANCVNVHIGKGCGVVFNLSKRNDRRQQMADYELRRVEKRWQLAFGLWMFSRFKIAFNCNVIYTSFSDHHLESHTAALSRMSLGTVVLFES